MKMYINHEVRAERQATIERAIRLLMNNEHEDLIHWLAKTSLHDHIKENPALLLENLGAVRVDDETARHFGAWKAAQQLLKAAGLPH